MSRADAGLEAVLKTIGMAQYGKAFADTEDLEWFLKLRSLYFATMLQVVSDVALVDEEDDSRYSMARKVLHLASDVTSASLCDDLSSLDHSVSMSTSNDAAAQARTCIVEAWATVLQRAGEVEVPGTKHTARTQSQWNQFRQTLLMQARGKSMMALRAIIPPTTRTQTFPVPPRTRWSSTSWRRS